jgi:D-glycero-D-manno-heptose 1,7-bisphosphate phosphatase
VPELAPAPAAFLDRDGTINVKAPEGSYITSPGQVRLLPGAADAIRRLNDVGSLVIVVTNQRGVARGAMTATDLEAIHGRLKALLAPAGARIDAVFSCTHDIGQCACRKPGVGLFEQALERFPAIDVGRSVMIGDAASDVEAGEAFGLRTIKLRPNAGDLPGAVELAISEDRCCATV